MSAARPRLLVVDDEQDLLLILTAHLESAGYEVETAHSGPEAIARARAGRFDVALTDYKMKGMDGLETMRQLRAIDPALSLILMTGYTPDGARPMLQALGGLLLTKPFEIGELLAVLEAARAAR